MNAPKNKVQLIGNLGQDPEVRTMDGGKKLARISLATNEHYRNAKGEKVNDTQWHHVVGWGKTAEIMERYLRKGSEVLIEGKLVNREYTDKNGNKRSSTEIHASGLLLLEKK